MDCHLKLVEPPTVVRIRTLFYINKNYFFMSGTKRARDSNNTPAVQYEQEDEDQEDPESIRSSDSEFY